jgi:tRNA1(Val) A37 N6-methylase TrmN6
MPVFYQPNLNGGGIILSYEFVRIIKKRFGKVSHIAEFAAGPGFIGFNLLANGLCDRLTLCDINPAAIDNINKTIALNHLEDRVRVFCSDGLQSIPTQEKWDLVVGNPPWDMTSLTNTNIRTCDVAGKVHANFFKDIHQFLKPSGHILFIEGREYTRPETFIPMIKSNNLLLLETFPSTTLFTLFKDLGSYPLIGFPLKIFLRISQYFRETYFLLIQRPAK